MSVVLPAPLGADKSVHLARFDDEIDVLGSLDAAKRNGQAGYPHFLT